MPGHGLHVTLPAKYMKQSFIEPCTDSAILKWVIWYAYSWQFYLPSLQLKFLLIQLNPEECAKDMFNENASMDEQGEK